MTVIVPGTNVPINLGDETLQALMDWGLLGSPAPCPTFMKALTLLQYATNFDVRTFIETGTCTGATTRFFADLGFECKTVELSPKYYKEALKTFVDYKNVELFFGDSGKMLPRMVQNATPPYLFWLDGHYSKDDTARGDSDTPIAQELEHLLSRDLSDSVIMIDDIREFGKGDYPSVSFLEAFVDKNFPDHRHENFNDIFRITPRLTLAEKMAERAKAA